MLQPTLFLGGPLEGRVIDVSIGVGHQIPETYVTYQGNYLTVSIGELDSQTDVYVHESLLLTEVWSHIVNRVTRSYYDEDKSLFIGGVYNKRYMPLIVEVSPYSVCIPRRLSDSHILERGTLEPLTPLTYETELYHHRDMLIGIYSYRYYRFEKTTPLQALDILFTSYRQQ